MRLIAAATLPTPADAERLLADLWQLSASRSLGLYTVALGGEVALGVHSRHGGLETAAASMIADQCGGRVSAGGVMEELVTTADHLAAVNLIPTDRHLAVESRTFGWQRSDPLRATFLALANLPSSLVTGVALSLSALPDLAFLVSLGIFSAGPESAAAVGRVASTFGGVGVRIRHPVLQRRAVGRMLSASVRRPASVHRTEVVTRFWHPPYGSASGLVAGASVEPDVGRLAPQPP